MIEKLMFLIFAHFIGDWGLQSNWMAENKTKYEIVMLAHCMIWTGCIVFAMKLIGGDIELWKVSFLIPWHCLIDECKYWYSSKRGNEMGWPLYLDQLLHIIQVVLVGVL